MPHLPESAEPAVPTRSPRAAAALAAFLIAVPLLGASARWAMDRALPRAALLQDQDTALESRLPPEWLAPSDQRILKIPKVKARHQFWAFERSNVQGAAIRALETRELRDALFPGYPDAMYEDAELWKRYFGRDFASTAWLPPLQSHATHGYGILVYQSWLGCLDILKRYGADGVIFGSSETFRSLVPATLSELLPRNADGSRQRVLLCTTTSAYPQQVEWVAHELTKPDAILVSRKPRWAIFGASLWSLYQGRAAFRSVQAEKQLLWERYLSGEYGHYGPDFRTADFFRSPTWDEVFSPNLFTFTKHRGRLRGPLDSDAYFANQPAWASKANFPQKDASDPAALQARLRDYGPTFPLLDGLTDAACADYRGDALLAPALRELDRVFARTVLFVPPISPRLRATIPACYLERFAATTRALQSNSRMLRAETAEGYSLADTDYLYLGDLAGVAHFDANHTNYGGAEKLTRRFAELTGGFLR